MTSEAPSPSSRRIQQQQELASFIPKSGKNVHNISMQTGEEFSMEFLQDRVTTRGICPLPSTAQNSGYEDLAHILGLNRMDSESADDISDFVSAKESSMETESGAYADKLNRLKMEDGDTVNRSGKVLSKLNCDRGAGLGPSASVFHALESPSSDISQPGKMKFLCSSGGKILPRPSDGKLRYVGGETRIISISKNLTWYELVKKTKGICNQPHSIKYQLPGEDLDALISVSSDEDLQNMIEEYHGLEKLEGSQRLRIFLIPLGESEKSSSFDGAAIQQDSPNYHYVLAVNGVLDPSPRENSSGQGSASEASQPGNISDHHPSFRKHSPSPLFPLEAKAGFNAFHPPRFSNEFHYMTKPPYRSPPISPIPIQHRDSRNSHVKSNGANSSVESCSSFITAQLPPDNCSTSTVCKQPTQGLVALMNHCKNVDNLQADQPHGVQSHSHNLGTEHLTPSVFHQSEVNFDGFSGGRPMHKERAIHSEKPFLGPDDPLGLLSAPVDSIDSHHGMPHAFSDSKLQEHGMRSAYCSQEGMSPSSPLNFSKTQLSSMVSSSSQEKPEQLHKNFNFVNPSLQSKLLDIESTFSQDMLDLLNFSSCSKSAGRNEPIQKATTIADDQCQIPKGRVELNSEMMTAVEKLIHFVTKLKDLNKSPHVNCNSRSEIDVLGHNMNISEDGLSASSAIDFKPSVDNFLEHSQNYQTPSDLLLMDQRTASDQNSSLHGKVNGEQGSNIPRNSIPEVEELFKNAKMHPRGESCLVDLTSGSSKDSFSHESAPVQPLESQNGKDNKDSLLISSTKSYQSVVHDDSGANTTLHVNEIHAAAVNCTNDASYEREVSHLVEDHGSYPDQKAEKLVLGGSAYEKSNVGNIMSAQTKTSSKNKDQNKLEPLFTVESLTGNVPCTIQSSGAVVPHDADSVNSDFGSSSAVGVESIMPHLSMPVTDPTSSDLMPPKATDSESIIPHVRAYVADPTSSDFISPSATISESIMPETEFEDIKDDSGDKDKSITDAVIAEMEASIYGLQIIKNADLEELRELGSGTYGTVYHGKWRGTDVAIKRIKRAAFRGGHQSKNVCYLFSVSTPETKDFWREAQILSNLHHPNVVAFYGVVPDGAGGTLATVTEYMVNGSLRHVLLKKDRSLDRRKKLIIAMDAAFGMEYLHSKNIVHFDLKCDNLLVNLRDPQRPICKVGDFGLSRIKRNTLVSGGVRGTLPWMAPELLNGSSSRVSEKVDVFSFGISLWEILTGRNLMQICIVVLSSVSGIVKNTLRPPIPECCDPEWRTLMEQCWSPDPESRPSFTEITNRLRAMSFALQTKGHNNIQARQVKAKFLS
ncbi:hypothetical protein P3X46_011393 [Hevea brasiliensis]|uniref:Protein kinase domain-containing protein n=1 Tax=Hevea brasiliensis TaxID=3981 RepID=A0ABQ9M858_HEVBR|nr:hypothetical protein P3X46_011393 [Hevea brasiliensis]